MLSEVETSPEYFCYLGGFFTAFSMTAEMKFEQVLRILKHGKANTNYVIWFVPNVGGLYCRGQMNI